MKIEKLKLITQMNYADKICPAPSTQSVTTEIHALKIKINELIDEVKEANISLAQDVDAYLSMVIETKHVTEVNKEEIKYLTHMLERIGNED